MDFHSLSRRELQGLCKKNKIPANMTNVAMADALTALEKVEGLDEFIMAHDSDPHQSPEKTMSGSPELSKTACRTSTRRKPKVEPETSQPLTRTRRPTRRTVAVEADQENKSVNLPETPAIPANRRRVLATSGCKMAETLTLGGEEDEKEENVVAEFAAAQSCQRRTPAASMRRKKVESSIQMVHSTRRSVRLLEKSMEELSLKDRGRVDAVDSDGFRKKIEEVREEKALTEADLQTTTEDIFEQSNNSEVIPSLDLDQSVEAESEMKPELHEDSKNNDNDVEIGPGKCHALDNLSGLNEDDNDETSDESDSLQCKGSEKGVSMNHEAGENNASDVFINENSKRACNVLTPGIDKDADTEGSLVVEVSDETTEFVMGMVEKIPHEISGEAMHNVVPAQFLPSDKVENSIDMEELLDSLVPSESVCENPGINSTENEQHHNDDHQSNFDIGEESVGKRSGEVQEETNAETAQKEVSNELATETYATYDVEALFDVNVDEAENHMIFNDYSTSLDSIKDWRPVEQMNSSCPPYSASGISENLVNVCVMQAEEIPVAAYECCPTVDKTPPSIKQESFYQTLFSGGRVTQESISVPFAAHTLQGQFPRPSEPTPRKSTTKKQATIQKTIQASEINKENIDNHWTKLEPKKEMFKKTDPEHEEILADMSLRKLTKMLRDKLQIANKNNEEKTFAKQVSNPRLALQTLPENCISIAEPEAKN